MRVIAIELDIKSTTLDSRKRKTNTPNKSVNTIVKRPSDIMPRTSTPTTKKQRKDPVGDYYPVECPECVASPNTSASTSSNEEVQQPANTWRSGYRTLWDWPAFASYQNSENSNPTNQASNYSFLWLPESRLLETSKENVKPTSAAAN